jgi:predicted kinase
MVMGLPKAGKTQYADTTMNIPEDAALVCVESHRRDTVGGPRMTKDSWEDMYGHISASLAHGEHVVVDGNNTQTYSRKEILMKGREFGAERTVLHVLCTPPNVCVKRLELDSQDKTSASKTIRHQTDMFFRSMAEIPHEGWDHIIYTQGETDA